MVHGIWYRVYEHKDLTFWFQVAGDTRNHVSLDPHASVVFWHPERHHHTKALGCDPCRLMVLSAYLIRHAQNPVRIRTAPPFGEPISGW